jgi:hypothetical protein
MAGGSIHCIQSRDELARFFQRVAETNHRDGYRDGRFKNLEVTSIGGRSAPATTDWELLLRGATAAFSGPGASRTTP